MKHFSQEYLKEHKCLSPKNISQHYTLKSCAGLGFYISSLLTLACRMAALLGRLGLWANLRAADEANGSYRSSGRCSGCCQDH